ncbi:hypothetical protein [Mycobacterium saskatchewanense]|uniref:hypothetical protein n=1 Tax=Mycobacterium saskatchewanense TaxID=220927 RepID=UPI001302D5ED|nr:hypothetical protein [Mycobacterium saskatchewanense]
MHNRGQATVHLAALRRRCAGQHTLGQQRLREAQPGPVNGDDAFGFGLLEQLDDGTCVGARGAG